MTMPDNQGTEDLGVLLKDSLKKQSLSMRKLSGLTNIDTATISRIINGKQAAKLDHLRRFAEHLHLPMDKLLEAVGLNKGTQRKELREEISDSVATIQELLQSIRLLDYRVTAEHVRQELVKYEQYAQTEEGNRIILESFHSKVKEVSGWGPFINQLHHMFSKYCDEQVTKEERYILGSALLYFILSADIIPDYLFPIGYIDDVIAVQLAMERLSPSDDSIA